MLAVQTLCQLDPVCLTAACTPPSTPPLAYLRTSEHPHAGAMVPLLEGMLLERGMVPFTDGSAVPVEVVEAVLQHRSEDRLKEAVRSGTIDFRQYKTLKLLLPLPAGFETSDESLAFLLAAAKGRTNPDGDPPIARDADGDDSGGASGCAIS